MGWLAAMPKHLPAMLELPVFLPSYHPHHASSAILLFGANHVYKSIIKSLVLSILKVLFK